MAMKQENRWAARPRTAAALKLAVYILPVVSGAVAANVNQLSVMAWFPALHWLVAAAISLPVAMLTVVGVGRLMRRLLPLAFLLRLSLLFPDQVPSRVGIALRASSAKRLARRLHEREGGHSGTAEELLALVTALGVHDRRTRGHSERVRAITVLLADELDIVGDDRDKLEWAALLHDLGKLDVPTEILNKKGRPTDAEWEIVRTHPLGGPVHAAGIADWLGEWIHALDQHHERFDGSGYPQGLQADAIALSGRIVAASDAFEVMTARRSYKEPMTTQAARDELVRCAGSHFDPVVVRAFMAISMGDLHRALGPSAWLASIPVVGPATTGIGQPLGQVLLGGSANPALAAAAALLLSPLVPQADPPPSSPPVAVALIDEPAVSIVATTLPVTGGRAVEPEPLPPTPAVTVPPPIDVEIEPPVDPEPDEPPVEIDPPIEVDPPVEVDPPIEDVVGDVVTDVLEGVVESVEGLAGDPVDAIGDVVDDAVDGVEPLAGALEPAVADVVEQGGTVVEESSVVPPVVEDLTDPIDPIDPVGGLVEPVGELVEDPVDGVGSVLPPLG